MCSSILATLDSTCAITRADWRVGDCLTLLNLIRKRTEKKGRPSCFDKAWGIKRIRYKRTIFDVGRGEVTINEQRKLSLKIFLRYCRVDVYGDNRLDFGSLTESRTRMYLYTDGKVVVIRSIKWP